MKYPANAPMLRKIQCRAQATGWSPIGVFKFHSAHFTVGTQILSQFVHRWRVAAQCVDAMPEARKTSGQVIKIDLASAS